MRPVLYLPLLLLTACGDKEPTEGAEADSGVEDTGAPGEGGVQMLALSDHSCALLPEGALRCWGVNWIGQLGLGHTDDIGDDETPASVGDVPVGAAVLQPAPGYDHMCALVEGGAVQCWGRGHDGRHGLVHTDAIGDDEAIAGITTVDVGGTVTQLSLGSGFSCALLNAGNVRCWGDNIWGQLGYGHTNDIGDDETPASAGDLSLGGPAVALALSNGNTDHMCALLEGGGVRCWGQGYGLGIPGNLSIGDNELPSSVPAVDVGGTVVQLAVGGNQTCALLDTGGVRCWGYNDSGRLGYGHTTPIGDDEAPASAGDVPVGGPVLQLAVGSYHVCAVLEGGGVRCWGSGERGRLGYGSTQNIGDDEPPADAGDIDLGGAAAQVALGVAQTCALLEAGTVRCWGSNSYGQLGYGHTNDIGDDETPASAGDALIE